MSEIILKPGQTLSVEVGQIDGRPTYAQYRYDELFQLIRRRHKAGSRRSKTAESKASRQVALMCRALETGTWSTGAPINKSEVKEKLQALLRNTNEYALTPKAKSWLDTTRKSGNL